MDVFINLQLTENRSLLRPLPGSVHKMSAKIHCGCRQVRLEQIAASETCS